MKPGAGVAVRLAAARSLQQVFDGASLKRTLATALPRFADSRDRALLEASVFQACRWRPRYEAVLAATLQRPLPASKQGIAALLLVGMAQLDAMGLPPHAVLSATVDAVKAWPAPGLAGLVNAVLRRFQREQADWCARWQDDPHLRHAFPQWLASALRADWGDRAEAWMQSSNEPAPLWLRVNQRRMPTAEYLASLHALGLDAVADAHLPAGIRLDARVAPTTLPGFDVGAVSVQDGAAQFCVQALGLRAGMRVLDACAAPGGKSAAMLEQHDLELTAIDAQPKRVEALRATLARLDLQADVRTADAGDPAAWWDGRPYARILLDAPCSATGVIRRQPDVKWHRRATDVTALQVQQARLLDGLWPLLEPGGEMIYATCSILRGENHEQVSAFLARHDDARLRPLGPEFGEPSPVGNQRAPGAGGMDGFFVAVLHRC
ncbi:MAG: 16S rRNA (cytosine(967)-C(5))-methyltransferase RsmB [Xanthomonadales bacterium]|nr:16S rRNA (cytosine(967)-C(5))-methyltransferase RsmB [Xanthomonadales bacterium]